MTTFSIVARSFSPNRGETDHVFLERDSWDDYTYKTLFHATYSTAQGELVKLGQVKIMRRGMTSGPVPIADSFDSLGPEYCSLGQDQSFYETVRELKFAKGFNILELLRDVVWTPIIFDEFLSEHAFTRSLLRSVDTKTIARFRQFLLGEHEQTGFHFTYLRPGVDGPEEVLSFRVEPESLPPTNVHALIGRNGIGKTTLLGRMAEAVCLNDESRGARPEIGQFIHSLDDGQSDGFANVISVSFSAFDDFPVPSGTGQDQLDTRYDYVGLRSFEHARLKTLPELTEEFSSSVELCIRSARFPFWRNAIETLSSDAGFEALGLHLLPQASDDEFVRACEKVYAHASAGHRLVLLTMAKLVETVGERTLILFDEPEAHLHPPLLGSFIRAVSELLLARNGMAIMATHSPVVLQELPASCVSILTRDGIELSAHRPAIETFGEAIGVLTHEVFGLEVKRSGHHALLSKTVRSMGVTATYESVASAFTGQLGTEASSIVLALLGSRKN